MPDRKDESDRGTQPPMTNPDTTGNAESQRPAEPAEHLSGDGAHTRRQVMKATGAVGVLAAVGAIFLYPGGSESAAATPLPEGVPERADVAAHGEADDLLADQSFRDAVDEQLQAQDVGIELGAVLDTVAETTGIDPRSVETVAGFGTVADGGGGAILVETDSSAETVRDALDTTGLLGDMTEETGQELYEISGPGSLWLAALGDGEFALGSRSDITSVIAVRSGSAPGIRPELGNAVAEADGGVIQFGAVIPDAPFDALGVPTVGDQFVKFDELEYAYGTIENGDLLVTIETTSDSTAEDIRRLFGLVARTIEDTAERLDLPEQIEASLIEILGGMETETDGNAVEVTLPDGVRLVAVVGTVLLGVNQFARSL